MIQMLQSTVISKPQTAFVITTLFLAASNLPTKGTPYLENVNLDMTIYVTELV